MQKVLITGATGNVGLEVIKALHQLPHQRSIVAGVRNLAEDRERLAAYNVQLVKFDFTDLSTYRAALADCAILFLLRPPQITAVEKYFKPLLDLARERNVQHIIFLSVQGVEKSSIIPHHKIEKLIVASKIPYTFLRPAYFMQNFTTTLRRELINNHKIFLPAGAAKFTLIDLRDVGAVAAKIIAAPEKHLDTAYELTNPEKLDFQEMATQLSAGLGTPIDYQSPNLLQFFLAKRKEKVPAGFILVMIVLHYLPRFQKEPAITDWVEKITGRPPATFGQFIRDHRLLLLGRQAARVAK